MKKKLVVLTGAGMSAESGIATFRDSGGLWERYPVEQVATPEGFAADPELVLSFYNMRRRELLKAFGGLQGVRQASVEDLAKVRGIGRPLAEKIYERMNPGP